MGIADIPTSFGPSFIIRTFIPGFIASLIYYIPFYSLYHNLIQNKYTYPDCFQEIINMLNTNNSSFTDIILVFAILGILLGIMLSELDVQIYQFFESLRFWPEPVWNWRYRAVLDEFNEIDRGLYQVKLRKKEIHEMEENSCDEMELRELLCKESELSAKAREYPYNPNMGTFCKRYPDAATRFGNIIAEYEQYSEIQYGMHMLVFWQHLWLILPSEIKEDLDLRGAKVDFLVYLSFIFLVYAFVGSAAFHFCGFTLEAIVCSICSLILAYLFYSTSISSVKDYGRHVKAVFDLYRFDLASKMEVPIPSKYLIPDEDEMESWRKLRKYLLDYKK